MEAEKSAVAAPPLLPGVVRASLSGQSEAFPGFSASTDVAALPAP